MNGPGDEESARARPHGAPDVGAPPQGFRLDLSLIAALHVAVALYYWLGRGVTIVHDFGPEPWSWFWQNVPMDLLRDRALESLWYLHAQPPLWNALGAVLIKVFGDVHLQALQALNILLGAATAALCASVVARITRSRRWGVGCGVVVALHPALFLYEAYALYTTLIAFAIMLAAFTLERARRKASSEAAVACIAIVSALVLTRSLYHAALLAVIVPLALSVSRRPSRRAALAIALICLAPVAWYAKNEVQYGFFGASSWYGMGLWRVALFRQDPATLEGLAAAGDFERVVSVQPFTAPSAYRPLGFDRTSDVPLLSRDDLHNINVPDISRAYYHSARALVAATPLRYAANVLVAYGNFCAPSSDFSHLEPNRNRIAAHATLEEWLLLRPLASLLERALDADYLGSIYVLLIPLAVLASLARLARARDVDALRDAVRGDAVRIFLALMVGYTAVVGCALELGENTRFKFMVEPALIVLLAVQAHRVFARARAAGPESHLPEADSRAHL